jgi:uncharacterized membrane protein
VTQTNRGKRTAPDRPLDTDSAEHGESSRPRLLVAVGLGVIGAVVMGVFAGWTFAALVGWDVAATVVVIATWSKIWPMDGERTARYAVREEPGRAITDLLLVGASVASLVGVGFVVVAGGNARGTSAGLLVALAVITVVLSWSVVHTTFALRYAQIYYSGPDGGVKFNNDEPPRYSDFAYLSFTIGMTFQVSDTALTSGDIRRVALRHALLSYVFGVVIIAVMINLIAGLSD